MKVKYSVVKGVKNNHLTLIKEAPPEVRKSKNGSLVYIRRVECQCDCGAIFTTRLTSFRTGFRKNCGCFGKSNKQIVEENVAPYRHPLHGVWCNMIQRCTNPNNEQYHNYGGRGVRVCKEWRNDYRAFLSWALKSGWKPGLKLDKDKAGKKLYSPNTCVFVTDRESLLHTRRSRRLYFAGVKYNVFEAEEKFKIPKQRIYFHLHKGRNLKYIVENAWRKGRSKITKQEVIEIFRAKKTNEELSLIYGICKNAIQSIKSGKNWSSITGKKHIIKRKYNIKK